MLNTAMTGDAIMITIERQERKLGLNGLIAACGLVIAISLLSSVQARAAETCLDHLIQAENQNKIPRGLLVAIALIESGRNGVPQPHALSQGSHTTYANSSRVAAKMLRDRKGKLQPNMYVGCMQLSLYHHGKHFQPVEKIVDPAANVTYAARYLKRLRAERGGWSEALVAYAGATGERSHEYVCKVWRNLNELDTTSARKLHSNCDRSRSTQIAMRTRRAVQQAQVASANPGQFD
ncbi:Lytic transglycosylase domain-containing protein [uncultured Gammaproteobacteria bacterium]